MPLNKETETDNFFNIILIVARRIYRHLIRKGKIFSMIVVLGPMPNGIRR